MGVLCFFDSAQFTELTLFSGGLKESYYFSALEIFTTAHSCFR